MKNHSSHQSSSQSFLRKFASASVLSMTVASTLAAANLAVASDYIDGTVDEVRNVRISRVFTPKGLDNNDNSIVILDGYLPDGCYRITAPDVRIDTERKVIQIQARANYFNTACIEALVPYTQEVSLGMLPQGIYSLKSTQGQEIGQLAVGKTTSKYPDEFLYAPLDDLIVNQRESNRDDYTVTIRGRFTNSCMFLDRVDVRYFEDSVEVLPIMGMRKGDCADVEVPFKEDITLDDRRLQNGRTLIHARSLNGRSLNAILNVMR